MNNIIVLILVGIPGCGKTLFGKTIEEIYPNAALINYNDFIIDDRRDESFTMAINGAIDFNYNFLILEHPEAIIKEKRSQLINLVRSICNKRGINVKFFSVNFLIPFNLCKMMNQARPLEKYVNYTELSWAAGNIDFATREEPFEDVGSFPIGIDL